MWCIDIFHELQVKFVLFSFCSHTAHVLWQYFNSLLAPYLSQARTSILSQIAHLEVLKYFAQS